MPGVGGRYLSSVEVLNGTSWSAGPELTTARIYFGLASHDGLLYAVGGWDGSTRLSSVEVSDGTSWSAGPDLPIVRRTVMYMHAAPYAFAS